MGRAGAVAPRFDGPDGIVGGESGDTRFPKVSCEVEVALGGKWEDGC